MATKSAENYAEAQEYEGGMMENYKVLLDAVVGNLTGNPPPPAGGAAVTAKDLKPENYGEYVDYGIDINKNNKPDDWKIFYVGGSDDGDANGRIFLIAADYVPQNCEPLTESLKNAKMEVVGENQEEYYWNDEPDYHCNDGHNKSLNQQTEDGQPKAQCSFPSLFMSTGYYCSSHVGNDGKSGNKNSRCASALQCTGNWKPFVEKSTNGTYADYAIGGPTLEMWAKSWNQKHGNSSNDEVKQEVYISGETGTTSATGYCVGNNSNPSNDEYCDLQGTDGYYYDKLYFSQENEAGLELDGSGDSNEECWGYWLASPSANAEFRMLSVTYYGRVEDNDDWWETIRCPSGHLS